MTILVIVKNLLLLRQILIKAPYETKNFEIHLYTMIRLLRVYFEDPKKEKEKNSK